MENIKNRALELASNALSWTDEAIQKFTSLESLPEPLDCKPGCHYCCYNLPMVTPPEALIIGHQVKQTFTDHEKLELSERIKRLLAQTDGRSPDEIVMMRHELTCIFLQNGICMVYQVRPAVCRACSSTNAKHCEMVFESRDHMDRLRCYQQIHEIFKTVHTELVNQCRKMGCQSDSLRIAEAVRDYIKHPNPIEAWLQGEIVFHIHT
jgi:Fe-S-cluster containining protein